MKEETIVRFMKTESAKLTGKVATFDKFIDKSNFVYDIEECLSNLMELLDDLKKVLKEEIK